MTYLLATVPLPAPPGGGSLQALDWSPDGTALLVQVGPRHLWVATLR
jgi:hypothetical protein